jgi:hypothetical protein
MNTISSLGRLSVVVLLLLPVAMTAADGEGDEKSASPWQPKDQVLAKWVKRNRPNCNFKEALVPKYELPALLVTAGGEAVTDAKTWTETQRPALLQLFREHMYGIRPATKYEIAYAEVGRRENAFGIGALGRQIRATVRVGERSHSFDFVIVIPKADRLVPVVVHINNRYFVPLDKAVDETDPFWPVETLAKRGYATIGFHTSDVDPDKRDRYDDGIRALLDDPESAPTTRWRSLSAWGWAASRGLDFALQQPEIDPKRTAIVGHSRGGKTALWAGAEDPRFAIVYSNNSGCGGAALFRRAYGERAGRISQVFPHWFCERFAGYAERENELPVDQHQLMALMAPRAVYVASADEDLWADPRGEYAALLEAGPAFQLLGRGHITSTEMPALDTPRHVGATGYHIRSGEHNLTAQDWGYFLDFADRIFSESGE